MQHLKLDQITIKGRDVEGRFTYLTSRKYHRSELTWNCPENVSYCWYTWSYLKRVRCASAPQVGRQPVTIWCLSFNGFEIQTEFRWARGLSQCHRRRAGFHLSLRTIRDGTILFNSIVSNRCSEFTCLIYAVYGWIIALAHSIGMLTQIQVNWGFPHWESFWKPKTFAGSYYSHQINVEHNLLSSDYKH